MIGYVMTVLLVAFPPILFNQVTPTENEAQLTFGRTKILFLTDIYNTRISFPNAQQERGSMTREADVHLVITQQPTLFGYIPGRVEGDFYGER